MLQAGGPLVPTRPNRSAPLLRVLLQAELRSIFDAFANFGSREPAGGMEGRAFSK